MPRPNQPPHDLSQRVLARQAVSQYRTWLRAGIWAAVLGYLLSLISLLLEFGLGRLPTLREPYVIATCLAAAALERHHKLGLAAWLVLGSLWFELHFSLVEGGILTSGLSAFPGLTLGATLFLGPRQGVFLALSTLVSTATALWLHSVMYAETATPGHLSRWVIAEACALATAFLPALFMKGFGSVLYAADKNAQRARQLVDGAPDGILAVDEEGQIHDCNPMAARMLGLEREHIIGAGLNAIGLTDTSPEGNDRPSIEALTGDVREYFVQNTGATLEGLLRSAPHSDGTAALIMLRDVTKRKEAEQRAAELQHQLQHAQKLEAVGQLAGGVSHDINNLLTAVGGYGDMLAHHPEPLVRDIAQELIAARERGTGLTRQLLAFARKELAEPRSMDLNETIRRMGRLLSRLVGEQVTLNIDSKGPAWIFADPGQIEQVILNLVMNARDACRGHGQIEVRCHSDANFGRVYLSVQDDGVGMDETTLQRAFEPFYTTKPRGSGTGLGLSTVHGIVESTSGKIDLHSEVGKGTEFVLSWPAHHEPASTQPFETPSPVPEGRQGRILLVEDDQQNRRFLLQLLSAAGFDATAAEDGKSGLAEYERMQRSSHPPDLLLTDVRMPQMDGFELVKRVHALNPSLPVIYMSGYIEHQADAETARELLRKPFSAEALLDRIDNKLGRSSSSSMNLRAQRPEDSLSSGPQSANKS